MSLFVRQFKFLSILAENSQKPYPQPVYSDEIAGRLNLSVKETQQIIKCLHDMEVVESDQEGHLSLITRKGMLWLEKYSAC